MSVTQTRRVEWEKLSLARAAADCLTKYRHRAQPFVRRAVARMVVGIDKYGDDAYLSKDTLEEALQETPDFANYLLLELQRLRPLISYEVWLELEVIAHEAMVHAAAAHTLAEQMVERRADLGRAAAPGTAAPQTI